MTDIRSKVYEIYSLEQLASGNSAVHTLHPLVKIISTLVYVICVISFDRYALFALAPYSFYPFVVMAMADIPSSLVFRRALLALPFALFAGLSNLLFDPMISHGLISFLAILLRTMLCVSAVLILVAVTPFSELTAQLRRLHLPAVLVILLEMTYRYIGTLLGEASSMFTAYQLRSRNKSGLAIRHMGSFVGFLLIRSFDRAERVYNAMKCRGYPKWQHGEAGKRLKAADYGFLAIVGGLSLLFRFADVVNLFSGWLEELVT